MACQSPASAPEGPALPQIIFDTDMGPDYDDAGALAMLHHLEKAGHIDLLATMTSNQHPAVAPTVDVINTYFGHPDLPLGVPADTSAPNFVREENQWNQRLNTRFPYDLSGQGQPAPLLYRRLLSQATDSSVTLVTVGFVTNLANLLQTSPDSLSPLDGQALVAQKVKRWVCMGGSYPEGKEFNLFIDPGASAYAIEHWPTKIIFSGGKIGPQILTGPRLVAETDSTNPVHDAYQYCMATFFPDKPELDGRPSWDQTAVLVAALGVEPWFRSVPGRCLFDPATGFNSWDSSATGHFYLTFAQPPDSVKRVIEDWMIGEK